MTRVGRLAALDQQVRQLESFGAVVNDERYAQIRSWLPYRPAIAAAVILGRLAGSVGGWRRASSGRSAIECRAAAGVVRAGVDGGRSRIGGLAVRALVATPINYARESLGGATSLSMLMPAFGESTFPARLLERARHVRPVVGRAAWPWDLAFCIEMRTVAVARWLLGAYARSAVAVALTQALRGGV